MLELGCYTDSVQNTAETYENYFKCLLESYIPEFSLAFKRNSVC